MTESLADLERAYQQAVERAEHLKTLRNLKIREALAAGETKAQLAEQTGLTRQRVGQIASHMIGNKEMTEKLRPDQKCHYPGCERKRQNGWTTCGRHKTAGISIKQWNRRTKRS